ncbi:hypothetical protein SeMB42_g03929 [Synchytrium endobioticum]|uniref:Disease resistance R13L4/SHOC-2-like LRR domain-containing protein n=1 Tax=Synchytrium endobioticum TaxID=286115 RepID=A0A507CWK4_9FUNG|nr:hypothetical protein SeLEV6574_g04944 [Synchytrium endobioticum]TPX45653.1 hypothetical protein SeMB42_g03929 [Synchytrium endobioticum]
MKVDSTISKSSNKSSPSSATPNGDKDAATTTVTTPQDLIAMITTEAAKAENSLNLSQRDLIELPPDIAMLTSLERLGLSSNRLTSLPIEFKSLRRLRYLNLKSNQLREVPPILGEMNHLEILDISRNKIRRLPNSFGRLMNLKVLSVARNRLVELPGYIGNMRELKVLKLECNPIEWPPPDVVHANSDISIDVWLKNLKDYLLREGDRRSALKRLPTREILSTESRLESELGANWKECDTLCDVYFKGRPPLKLNELSSRGDRVLDICRTVAFATAQLYRVVRQMVANVASDRAIVEREVTALNRPSRRLIALLMETEERMMKAVMSDDSHGRLKSVAATAVTEAKRLVIEITSYLPVLIVKCDPRLLRSILVSWYSVASEVAEALQASTELAISFPAPTMINAPHLGLRIGPSIGGNSDRSSPSTHPFVKTQTNDSNIPCASQLAASAYPNAVAVVDSTFLSMAEAAARATSQLLGLLRDIPELISADSGPPHDSPSTNRSSAVDRDGDSGTDGKKSTDGVTPSSTNMSGLIKQVSDTTASLVQTINEASEKQSPMLQNRVYEDVNNFVKSVVQMSVGARDVAKKYPLSSQTKDGLQQVTRATRELAAYVSRSDGGGGGGSSIGC